QLQKGCSGIAAHVRLAINTRAHRLYVTNRCDNVVRVIDTGNAGGPWGQATAALVRITPEGLAANEYEAAGLPLDPAIIGPLGFRLTYSGIGNDDLINPIEIVIGVPGTATGLAPALTAGSSSRFSSVTIDLGDSSS